MPEFDQFLSVGRNKAIPKTIADQPSTGDFDLVVRGAKGNQVLVNIGASYIPPQLREKYGQVDVFFSMRQVNPRRLLQRIAMAQEEPDKTGSHKCDQLTRREKEILGLAVKGMKTSQIASHLCVSIQTVRTHFKNIYPKLGVNSRTEAVTEALKRGWIVIE